MEELMAQVAELRRQNHQILTSLRATTQHHVVVESENAASDLGFPQQNPLAPPPEPPDPHQPPRHPPPSDPILYCPRQICRSVGSSRPRQICPAAATTPTRRIGIQGWGESAVAEQRCRVRGSLRLRTALISFIFLIFILLAPSGHAKRNTPSGKKSSPFDFVNKLKGCHKGNNTKEIHELKAYLEKFGYLKYPNKNQAIDDDFDDILESAIKTYQENYHIKPSGIVDDETISKMTTPRCGVPDIVNGTNYMQPRNRNHESGLSGIDTVSLYSFFPGNPKWPPSRTHLTYRFLPNLPAIAMDPVARAFQKWQSSTHFTFARAQPNQNSDLVIGFYSGDHGDIDPFVARDGTLAHAFAPMNGSFHYNADNRWSNGAFAGAHDLETVALHEIGHLLGLGHSSDAAVIMFPNMGAGLTKDLNANDIQGIRTLYNR
ncbi:metalloendoproteinase 5-MMP-like [Salvia miltiorrhiza]|uniref:metalloendoproteinase 5-MMP-like n=1 Tax=Salvia miltiorrhiza TaxID=226208 RepID=UPI0025AD4533|nr:metalloendoproteinase 5-MMP-like [Salvia miltiorrhiza]